MYIRLNSPQRIDRNGYSFKAKLIEENFLKLLLTMSRTAVMYSACLSSSSLLPYLQLWSLIVLQKRQSHFVNVLGKQLTLYSSLDHGQRLVVISKKTLYPLACTIVFSDQPSQNNINGL